METIIPGRLLGLVGLQFSCEFGHFPRLQHHMERRHINKKDHQQLQGMVQLEEAMRLYIKAKRLSSPNQFHYRGYVCKGSSFLLTDHDNTFRFKWWSKRVDTTFRLYRETILPGKVMSSTSAKLFYYRQGL